MNEERNILDILSSAEAEANSLANRALIIQPGAIGDCVLTLPIADFLKKNCDIGTVDMLGRSHYMEYLPGRSCIDGIKDLDSIDLHRLFVNRGDFELQDYDSLLTVFGGYQHIFSFIGQAGEDFEHNLIYTANCSNPVEVTTVSLKPPADCQRHITKFYLDSIFASCPDYKKKKSSSRYSALKKKYLKPFKSDISTGRAILESFGIKKNEKPAVIHPGSGGVKKCWHIDNFYLLAEELLDDGEKVIFLLGPAEQERFGSKIIDRLAALAPVVIESSLTRTFQLLCCGGVFLGNDCGIAHIASAAGVPAIICFGPTEPDVYRPTGSKLKVFKFNNNDFSSPCCDAVGQVKREALKVLSS